MSLQLIVLIAERPVEGVTPYNDLFGETPLKRGTIFWASAGA